MYWGEKMCRESPHDILGSQKTGSSDIREIGIYNSLRRGLMVGFWRDLQLG